MQQPLPLPEMIDVQTLPSLPLDQLAVVSLMPNADAARWKAIARSPSMDKHPKPYSVIRPEAPMPETLTKAHALVALYALQQWEVFAPTYATPLSGSYFYAHVTEFLSGLDNVSRKTALKHIDARACLVCETAVDLAHSVLDHIIARAHGGPEALQNSIVLCRRCNSSKGTKDLLEWWLFKNYRVADLPRNIVCLYARIHWQYYGEQVFADPIPSFLRQFLLERAALLPHDSHRIALYGAAFAGCAFARWLKEPQRHGS